jgi:glycosyltransferase involved in cell wall biosynthesis
VHFFTIKPMVYGGLAARLAGTPGIVATVTGRGFLAGATAGYIERPLQALLKRSLGGRTRAIFQNDEDRQWYVTAGIVPAERAEHIAGSGVDTAALAPLTGLDPGRRRTFVMAGRMLKSKGVVDFVEAARLVAQQHADAAFVLFGGAREDYGSKNPDFIDRSWLEQLNREGIVSWRGRTPPDELEAAMRTAAAVVLPSYYAEGVPRTLIEAASAGAPVITTDMPGCRDTVIEGRTGFLVPPRTPAAIARAMNALLEDRKLLGSMAAAGREHAIATFDSGLITRRTLMVYQASLGPTRPEPIDANGRCDPAVGRRS